MFPNSKPWATKSLNVLLNRCTFREGYLSECNELEKKVKIEKSKKAKQKLESKLSANKLGSVWDGLKAVVGSDREKEDS